MASLPHSQLSAIGSAIEELAGRCARLASEMEGSGESEAVTALYEAERSLQMAARGVGRAQRSLDG